MTNVIKVYQWHLNEQDHAALEAGGWGANETTMAYADKGMDRFDATAWFHKFSHVANVATGTQFDEKYQSDYSALEESFEIMNHWNNPELVERLGKCASMSVGDIVEFKGQFFVVTGTGFEEIAITQQDMAS